jgi:peptide-methionine (S)-S-oxide reductase
MIARRSRDRILRRMGAALTFALAACLQPAHADSPVKAPPAVIPAQETPGLKTAVFAGGCYWGMEAVFSHLAGVTSVVSGFAGGRAADADYETVSTGTTGHAESIRVTYDPARIRYDQLLQVFFGVASDPTQLDRQEPDVGPQYRNALVPIGPEQARVARAYVAQLKALKLWKQPIVTRIEPWRGFYPGPAEHQDFALRNPRHPYILRWDVARVEALHRTFPQWWKPDFTQH